MLKVTTSVGLGAGLQADVLLAQQARGHDASRRVLGKSIALVQAQRGVGEGGAAGAADVVTVHVGDDDLVHLLPEGPLYFPIDQSTDMTLEDRVAEVIREKALHLTRDEVPHAIMVVVEEISEKVVRAVLLVETGQILLNCVLSLALGWEPHGDPLVERSGAAGSIQPILPSSRR